MYKKLKKASTVLLIVFTLLTMFTPVALAADISNINISQCLSNEINNTNEYVFKEIDKAIEKAEKESQKNQSQEKLDKEIDKIIDNLLKKTEDKVDKLIEKAAKQGIELKKVYIEVQILDRTVLVDPLFVH